MHSTAEDLADLFQTEKHRHFKCDSFEKTLEPISQELAEILKKSENTMDLDADATLPFARFIISVDNAHELFEPFRRDGEHLVEAYDVFRYRVEHLTMLPIAFIALSGGLKVA
jgi:hypothetical protein